MVHVAAPEADVIEFDEICIRFSPGLWLWTAVSRLTRQLLGFVIGDRTDECLCIVWAAVPPDYQDKPVYSDHWDAYRRFFSPSQHYACDKGSGETSIVEASNTRWRQRQSGLVRRSCGVCERIIDDLTERFLILVDSHNRWCAKRWEVAQLRN